MMNNKVGMVPLLYDEINYGGVLQFYALQKIVKQLGFEPEIVYVDDNYKFMQKYSDEPRWKRLARFVLKPFLTWRNRKRMHYIQEIIKTRISKTDSFKNKYYSPVVPFVNNNLSQYKALLCGSDQIWNPNNARKRQFLAFAPPSINKVIYAASLGCEQLNKKQVKAFRSITEDLNHISVREQSAQTLLSACLCREDIKLVADPTLLLKPEEWDVIIPDLYSQYDEDDYVFVYVLGSLSDEMKATITKYASNHSKKIIRISYASGESIDNEFFGDIQLADQDPSEFLMLIKHADCVFTDSYHACIFSVMFKKKFYVFERDGKTDMFNRIYTLLSSFDLPEWLIVKKDDINDRSPDYSLNNYHQEKLINNALGFLSTSLNV